MSNAVMQLLPQIPMLLAYLIAMILAVTFWQRCPTSALLTFVAGGLLLIVSIAQTFLNWYLIHGRDGLAAGNGNIGSILAVVGLVGSVLRALGFGLLLAAVFTGRSRAEGPWTE